MDKLQNCEEITSLNKLGDEYERQLRMVGIELSDLPEECSTLLDQYAEYKLKTDLVSLDKSFLDMYYCMKKKDFIQHKYNKFKMNQSIQKLEEEIVKEQKESKVLEDFIDSTKLKVKSMEDMQRQKIMIEKQIESLLAKQAKSFKPPSDINMDELIAKVELLEAKRKHSKPKRINQTEPATNVQCK